MSYPKPPDFKPVPGFPEGHHNHGKARCQAWNTAKGRQCLGLAMVSVGVDKCKTHGGRALRGMAAPALKTGRYSKVLPARLASYYKQLEDDSALMDMKSRAMLLETRIMELVDNLDTEGTFEIFRRLRKQMALYETNMQLARNAAEDRRQDYGQKAAAALQEVSRLISRGLGDAKRWQEIQNLTESVRKLADTEQRQIRTAETVVMVDRVLVFATMVASIFRSIVDAEQETIDKKVRTRMISSLSNEVQQLLMAGEYDKKRGDE